ncbi:MAG: hypothetical protein SWJ54_16865 [Cyanobacteriota bacterium]|nr:hypothetical protein [Cyanobacteriota bacterium]
MSKVEALTGNNHSLYTELISAEEKVSWREFTIIALRISTLNCKTPLFNHKIG